MKAAPFDYHAPESLEDVKGLLAAHGDDARILAGGQSLLPMLAMRLANFTHLVDLHGVDELRGIVDEEGDIAIGAMTRQTHIERSEVLGRQVPLLQRATPFIGHFQIRNRGTVGGSLAHADPAAEYPAVALALDATLDAVGADGRRSIPASEFFRGTWTTALEADEVLIGVRFPKAPSRSGSSVHEVARRRGDFAMAGAVCQVTVDEDDRILNAAIAIFGVGARPYRPRGAEEALCAAGVDADLAEIAELALREVDFISDLHADADYRRRAAAAMVRRGLTDAIKEATA